MREYARYLMPFCGKLLSPNINAISGALITLNLSMLILNSQCEEGARDGIDNWYMGIKPVVVNIPAILWL